MYIYKLNCLHNVDCHEPNALTLVFEDVCAECKSNDFVQERRFASVFISYWLTRETCGVIQRSTVINKKQKQKIGSVQLQGGVRQDGQVVRGRASGGRGAGGVPAVPEEDCVQVRARRPRPAGVGAGAHVRGDGQEASLRVPQVLTSRDCVSTVHART